MAHHPDDNRGAGMLVVVFSAVVVRLDRTTQYSRDVSGYTRGLWDTGSPAFAGDDTE